MSGAGFTGSDGGGLGACVSALGELFDVVEFSPANGGARVVAVPRAPLAPSEAERLYARLASLGCYPMAFRDGGAYTIYLATSVGGRRLGLAALLLGAVTVALLYVSGLALALGEPRGSGFAWSPWAYVVGLLVPLMIHELGHYTAMRALRVPSSVPVPLPAPPLQLGFLGTFGPVIVMRWPPPTASSLALVGVAGPLAGFVAALPVLAAGLKASLALPAAALPPGVEGLPLIPLVVALAGEALAPKGDYLILSPLAFGGYVMMFVTFLNLMPIGQLDGGHVTRAALGQGGHALASKLFVLGLLAASIVAPQLGLFALIALFLYLLAGKRHPGPALAVEALDSRGVAAVIAYAVLLVLTMPIPAG